MKAPKPANPRALGVTAAFAAVLVIVMAVTSPGLHRASSTVTSASVLLPEGTPRAGCTSVVMAVSPDDVDGLAPLIAMYDRANHQVGGQCVDARILPRPSGAVADSLVAGWKPDTDGPAPAVWLPGASSWVVLVRSRAAKSSPELIPADTPSFAQSPFVIAMPRPMATALGWPGKEIGFTDLVALGTGQSGWASLGHPEWGTLRLGKTNPLLSTSGLHALVAAYFAASGTSADLRVADLSSPKVVAFVKGVELATVHYGESSIVFLQNLARADAAGGALTYVSAIALDERQVVAYNEGRIPGMTGRPSVPLAAIYPKEGTLISDNPFVVLNGSWVSAAQKAAAADVLAFLQSSAQQASLRKAGYRDAQGKADAPATGANGTLTDEPKRIIKPPVGDVLDKLQLSWWTVRKPARALLIVDVSGSMDEIVPAAGASKLDLVKAALLAALGQVGNDDEIGLWSFSDSHTSLVPIAPAGAQRDQLKQAVGGLHAGGGTLLYSSVTDGWKYMEQTADPTHISAIVVLTDGQDTNSPSYAYSDLLTGLSSQPPATAIRIFTVAYGVDADKPGLAAIAHASRGDAYDATDPTLIREVFLAVISNF